MRTASMTSIAAGRVRYRGHDACELAQSRSVEEVASLLWTGAFDADIFDTPLHVVSGGGAADDLPFVSRAQSILPLVAARDPLAHDLRPAAVAATGWRIVNLLASVAADTQALEETLEETLAAVWRPDGGDALATIRAALILSAADARDPPVRTARYVASAGSHPYAVVIAALAALEGTTGGGNDRFSRTLRRNGDRRADLLLSMLGTSNELPGAARPSLEDALAAVERVLALPRGSGLTIYAIGRTIGWIAHAIDEYRAE